MFTSLIKALKSIDAPGKGASGFFLHPFPQCQALKPEPTTYRKNAYSTAEFHPQHPADLLVKLSYGVIGPVLVSQYLVPTFHSELPTTGVKSGPTISEEGTTFASLGTVSQALVATKGKFRHTDQKKACLPAGQPLHWVTAPPPRRRRPR